MDRASNHKKPLVAIRCITYNHEKYIRDALEGFVMQKTTFPFVAIVHDDASTDGTATIIREYAQKYPDIIIPIIETENQYSKHDGSLGRIMNRACEDTGAIYYALCEGDDYWTDPYKLQKQVDFLESHPDYTLCFHNAIVHYENEDKPDHKFATLETREYNIKENIDNWIVPTASVLFRRTVLESTTYKNYIRNKEKFVVGDQPLILSCASSGKLYGFSDIMSVYRLQSGGWTQQSSLATNLAYKLIIQEIAYMRIFGGYYKKAGPLKIAKHSRAAISLCLQKNFKEALRIWRVALRFAPWQTIRHNLLFAIKLLKSRI